jgi:hypothetical protein
MELGKIVIIRRHNCALKLKKEQRRRRQGHRTVTRILACKVDDSIEPIHLHFGHLIEIGSDKTQTRKCLMSNT